MIERVAFLKLAPAHVAERDEIARRAMEVLRPLPGVAALSVGVAGDADTGEAWDLVVTATFATAEDAARYRAHPVHRAFVDEYVAPRAVARKAWTFFATRR